MPMVLFGMALAIAIATLGWSRSWTRRSVSSHAATAWQARLLAESATACALQEAAARETGTRRDSTAKDTSAVRKPIPVRDTTDSVCGFRRTPPGSMSWDPPAGTQLLSIRARGEVTESGKPLVDVLLSTWGGAPPPDPFSPALSLWDRNAGTPQLRGKVRGEVRLRVDGPAPTGFKAQPSGGIQQFVPSSIGADTAAAVARMTAAFRSESAILGGDRFGPSHPPPDSPDSLVYTLGDVVFEGPWSGSAWRVPGARTLIVEGRVELRGQVELEGWRILAKGPVVLQDQASARGMDVFSLGGIRLADQARASGQFLSKGSMLLSGRSALQSPSFAAVWPGKGADSIPRISLLDRSSAVVYAVALGGNAEIRLAGGSDFRGVAVSGGLLANETTLHGLGVAGRLDCGQGPANCSSGHFDRPTLPSDFAFPLGLPGNLGLRLVAWEIER
jgi:hypothetical protein